MKDLLANYRLDNLFPANRSHTHYYEFMKMPHTGLDDENCLFNDTKKKFNIMNKPMQTVYYGGENG